MFEEGAFPGAGASQDDKHLAALHSKSDVLEDELLAVADLEVSNLDCRLSSIAHLMTNKSDVNTASAMMISKMLLTTARVVESPTALGPLRVCNPRRQPIAATMIPKIRPFTVPTTTSVMATLEMS